MSDYYSTSDVGTLVIPAPGPLANCEPGCEAVLDAVPTEGTFVAGLNTDGAFTYKPNAGATGWDQFTYKPRRIEDGLVGTAVTVHILITPSPKWLFFDRYKPADWSPLASLLANW